MDWSDVTAHLTGLTHLATITADGRPHVAIVSALVEGDVIWIGANATSRKARNVAVHPHAAMVWSAGAEAYVDADVELVTDLAEKERLWTQWPYDPAMFFGSPDGDDYVLLKCTPTAAMVMAMDGNGPPRRQRWKAGR